MANRELARILDVGCGPHKLPGAIGIDRNPDTAADVICDIDRGALPFADDSFDRVRASHVIEHVADVIQTMEEFHRVTRSGGIVYLVTPHYSDYSSFCDPTHRWHLTSYSFYYFYPEGLHGEPSWYTRARFRERRVRIKLLRFWKALGFEFLVNHLGWVRRFWEHYLCFVVRGKVLEFELEVLK